MHKQLSFTQHLKLPLSMALLAMAVGCTSMTKTEHNNTQRQEVILHQVSAQGINAPIGKVYLSDSAQGLKIETQLSQIPAGVHGFHIHEFGSCAPSEKDGKMIAAQAAGGHFNPLKVGHGDENNGHLGDLPPITVDASGNNQTTVYAPRLKLADVKGRALMIHAGGDNHSDQPLPLGGGGARIACGLIQ